MSTLRPSRKVLDDMRYTCDTCEQHFERAPSATKRYKHVYCSTTCYDAARRDSHTPVPDVRCGRKRCTKCKRWKKTSLFHPRYGARAGKLSAWCKACHNQSGKLYKRNNPDFRRREAMKTRLRRLEKKYGITKEDYDVLLASQDFGCAICSGLPKKKGLWDPNEYSFAVDHCHATGAVRGLLCDLCNQALGFLKDDPKLLRTAANYLETASRRDVSSP